MNKVVRGCGTIHDLSLFIIVNFGGRRAPPPASPNTCRAMNPPRGTAGGGSTTSTGTGGAGRRGRGSHGDGIVGAEQEPQQRQQQQQRLEQRLASHSHLHLQQQQESSRGAVVDGGGAVVDSGGESKKASELWHIHGRHFDLTAFLDHHPVSERAVFVLCFVFFFFSSRFVEYFQKYDRGSLGPRFSSAAPVAGRALSPRVSNKPVSCVCVCGLMEHRCQAPLL